MHVGLNYLPTSERLTIRVLRCSNIPLQNLPPADPGFNRELSTSSNLRKMQVHSIISCHEPNSPTTTSLFLIRFASEFFIRVLFYHNGKLIKRKKTTARPGLARSPSTSSTSTTTSGSSHCSPVLDDSFMFDVPLADIDNVVFVVILCLAATVVSARPVPFLSPTLTEG